MDSETKDVPRPFNRKRLQTYLNRIKFHERFNVKIDTTLKLMTLFFFFF